MYVIRVGFRSTNLYPFQFVKLPQYFAYIHFDLMVGGLSSVFGSEHNMILVFLVRVR